MWAERNNIGQKMQSRVAVRCEPHWNTDKMSTIGDGWQGDGDKQAGGGWQKQEKRETGDDESVT